MKIALIGLGGRGSTYAHFVRYYGSELVAVCDVDPKKKSLAMQYGMPEEGFYTDEEEFFAKGKLADAIVISTMDTLHYRQTMRALELGYDVLLEKPIATTLQECIEIRNKAKSLGRKVVICHVLRYAPIYNKVKELLDGGAVGDIVAVEMTEHIGYYHFAHSYVRGNWRNEKVSLPLILAKNCHHIDLICWFLGKKCLSVSSFGSLKHFKQENSPVGSTERCATCPCKETCKYNAFYIYNNEEYEAIAGLAKHGQLGITKEEIDKNLSDPDNLYGRCVYRCDNDIVDNQIVNMQFEDGIVAQLKSLAFSNDLTSVLKVYGTEGILSNLDEKTLKVEKLNGETTEYEVEELEGGYAHHAGGDVGIVKQFIEYLETGKAGKNITDIEDSVMGHEVGFLAEESRKQNGKLLFLSNNL
jgi:predicted dehydrogenase